MPRYVGYATIRHNPETKAIWLEKSGKADAKAYPGTVKTRWNEKNVAELVSYMEAKAKELGAQIGKASKNDPEGERYQGFFEPNGREGNTPVLMRGRFNSVFIQWLAPQERAATRTSKIQTLD